MGDITFVLAHALVPGSAPVADARALRILLDCLIELDLAYLQDHAAKPLYRAGVVYDRTEKWYPIPALYQAGFGDCKSLAAARIAEIRHAGGQAVPVFRWVVLGPDGSPLPTEELQRYWMGKSFPPGCSMAYHILVQTPAGYEDPSKVLGMGANENTPAKVTGR